MVAKALAVVKRKSIQSRKLSKKSKEKLLNKAFPTKPNVPSRSLSTSVIMLYGEKKIGKTSLAAEFSKKMFHLMFEPQARELEIYQESCPDYEHGIYWINKLLEEKHNFDSVSIDPLPLFYNLTMDYTGKVRGFEHPHDEKDYGKSWGLVYKDFSRPLLKLLHSNLGVTFHAHETEEEIETREGRTFIIRRPDGVKGVRTFIDANIENIWYYHKRGRKRFLQIRGDDFAFACCSFIDRFFTPSGKQIFAIPMGDSPKEGYANLVKAFNNKQLQTFDEFEEKEVLIKKVVKRKKKQ